MSLPNSEYKVPMFGGATGWRPENGNPWWPEQRKASSQEWHSLKTARGLLRCSIGFSGEAQQDVYLTHICMWCTSAKCRSSICQQSCGSGKKKNWLDALQYCDNTLATFLLWTTCPVALLKSFLKRKTFDAKRNVLHGTISWQNLKTIEVSSYQKRMCKIIHFSKNWPKACSFQQGYAKDTWIKEYK